MLTDMIKSSAYKNALQERDHYHETTKKGLMASHWLSMKGGLDGHVQVHTLLTGAGPVWIF